MKKVLSPKWGLNQEDIKRLFRNILIMYGPVLLLLLDQVQSGVLDSKILYATALGITLDTIRRLIREVTSNG